MMTISLTPSYEIDVPAGFHEDIDGSVTSLWVEGSQLALQFSSFIRSEGNQVLARQRLQDRIKREGGDWTGLSLRLRSEIEDAAAAVTTDREGTAWVHAYITWPDLCIYATMSGPPEQVAAPDNWALIALSSVRRAKPA